MTKFDFVEATLKAAANGDRATLILVAKIAREAEEVKQTLRKLGFGVTGSSLKQTVDELLSTLATHLPK